MAVPSMAGTLNHGVRYVKCNVAPNRTYILTFEGELSPSGEVRGDGEESALRAIRRRSADLRDRVGCAIGAPPRTCMTTQKPGGGYPPIFAIQMPRQGSDHKMLRCGRTMAADVTSREGEGVL